MWKTPITPQTAATLTTLMIGVVNSGTGSCCMQLDNGIQAAAKTGTAQLNSRRARALERLDHRLRPGRGTRSTPIAVMLEGRSDDEISAGTGGKLAGPIAKTVLDYALRHDAEPRRDEP